MLVVNVDSAELTLKRTFVLRRHQWSNRWLLIDDLLTGLNEQAQQKLIEVDLKTGAVQARSVFSMPFHVSMRHN